MRFLNKYSDTTLRFFIVLITLYCVIAGGIPVFYSLFTNRLTIDDSIKIQAELDSKPVIQVQQVFRNGSADKAGLKIGDVVIAVNGTEVPTLPDFQNVLSRISKDSPAEYYIIRGGVPMTIQINVHRYFHLIFYIFVLLGFGFLFNGFFVGISKPKELTSEIFFLLSAAASQGFLIYGGVWYYAGKIDYLMTSYFVASIFIYPLIFHFFSVYPLFYDFRKRKLKIFSVYLIAVLINLPAFFQTIYLQMSEMRLVEALFTYYPLLFIAASIVLFLKSYVKIKDREERKPLRILLAGVTAGFLGLLYYYVVFPLLMGTYNMNPALRIPIVLVLAIPIAFGWSIYNYKILDTEFFVKRSLVFGIVTAVTIAGYMFLITMIDNIFDSYNLKNKQLITVIIIVLVIFSFSYVTKLIKVFVDKRFYKSRYNYRKSLLDFSNELPLLNSIEEVCTKLSDMLGKSMGVKKVTLLLSDGRYIAQETDENDATRHLVFLKLIFKDGYEPQYLQEQNLAGLSVPAEQIGRIKEKGYIIAFPVTIKNELAGALLMGSKPENTPYSEEDIDLLKTICSNISIALENSRLRIEEYKKNLIEEELKIAKNIQEGLLPVTSFKFGNLEISCLSRPARIIGGDFYDVIKIDDDKILVVIADVSGKGLPAALYMAKVQALIRFAAKVFRNPKEIMVEVNKQVYERFEKKSFVTVSLGLFDLRTNKVRFIRAGHNPAIHARNGSIELLNTRGIGLGLDRDELFKNSLDEYELEFGKDNLLFFYTDGLNEAMNREREEFGMERLINIIQKHKKLTPPEISTNLINEVVTFSGNAEQHDDITLVVVKTY
ncbi:MAG: SpoIIE family protein phosphatase [Bacteroidetes bacterium]|nr:SpoIIE family protein phosphatase [Bacteroidota bacterium]